MVESHHHKKTYPPSRGSHESWSHFVAWFLRHGTWSSWSSKSSRKFSTHLQPRNRDVKKRRAKKKHAGLNGLTPWKFQIGYPTWWRGKSNSFNNSGVRIAYTHVFHCWIIFSPQKANIQPQKWCFRRWLSSKAVVIFHLPAVSFRRESSPGI